QDVLILAVAHFHVFAAILGVARDLLLSSRCCEAESVIKNVIQSYPFTYFAIGPVHIGSKVESNKCVIRIVPVLADIVDRESCIHPTKPRARWAVIEETRVPTVVSERATAGRSKKTSAKLADHH